MQAEAPDCRERPIGNRTRRGVTRTTAWADAPVRPGRLLAVDSRRLTSGA
jgi:hypothetical protein